MACLTPWWREGVGYQIWPASFKDSNDDGIGDLNGIISELDHVKNLGVDFIWLSPVCDSPQADAGYDVRDYENIWAPFGTLQDMDSLIAAAHAKGLKVVMDLVVNHTSDEHRWFTQSKQSRGDNDSNNNNTTTTTTTTTNSFSDWYHWRDPKYDVPGGPRKPPNNWRAAFGGSVWTYVAERDQYYLHLCQPKQPDLNWHHPAVREAVYRSAVDFWLRRGIDGFRVDVVNFYWKDPAFPDARVVGAGAGAGPDELQPMEARHVMNDRVVCGWLRELRGRIARDHGRYVPFIGELPGVDADGVLEYIAGEEGPLDMVFDMDIMLAGNEWNTALHERRPVNWPALKRAVVKTQSLLDSARDAWPTAFLENHDHSRSLSVLGPGQDGALCWREKAAKMLALLVGSLSGTLFIYQGQEIGMANVPDTWTRQDLRDSATIRYLDEVDGAYRLDGTSTHPDEALKAARRHGRDNARTPVQWSAGPYGGFSSADPWIRVNEDYRQINVAEQSGRPSSVLSFWQDVIKLRKSHKELLVHGRFRIIDEDSDETFCFLKVGRDGGPELLLVVLNVTGKDVDIPALPETVDSQSLRVLIGSYGADSGESKAVLQPLKPWEGRVYTSRTGFH